MAYWFVAILVLSAVPGVVPTVSAATTAPTVTTFKLEVMKSGTTTFRNATEGEMIVPGDTIRFYVAWNAAACTEEDATGGGKIRAAGQTFTINVATSQAGPKSTLGFVTPVLGGPGAASYDAITDTVTVDSRPVGVDELAKTFSGTLSAQCTGYTCTGTNAALDDAVECAQADTGDDDPVPAPTPTTVRVRFDNQGPLMPALFPITWANGSQHAVASVATKLGVGTTLTFSPTATDNNSGVKEYVFDFGALGGGTSVVVPAGGSTTFTVPATPVLTGLKSVLVKARDTLNNDGPTAAYTFDTDNVPPAAPVSNVRATVERNARTGSLFSTMTWTAPAGEPKHAQVTLVGSGVVGNFTTGTTTYTRTLPNPMQPIVLDVRPFDDAGNLGPSLAAPALTPNMTGLRFGSLADPLPLVLRKDQVGRIWFNITDDILPIHGAVAMNVSHSLRGYLKVGTLGSANDHFQATPGAATTFLRGHNSAGYAGGVVELANLSGTSLMDGNYLINITVLGASGNVAYVHIPFRVDSLPPAVALVPLAHTVGAGVTHGLDNNYLDVNLEVNDSRTADMGIANFTVELIHRDTSDVVQLADGSRARVEFTPADCGTIKLPVCTSVGNPSIVPSGFTFFNQTLFKGRLNLSFPGLPPGDYRIRAYARDLVNNTGFDVEGNGDNDLYRARPLLHLVSSPTTPFASSSGVSVAGIAGYFMPPWMPRESGLYCVDPDATDANPAATLCQVPVVRFLARNIESDGTVGTERLLGQKFSVGQGLEPVESFNHTLRNAALTTFTHKGFLYADTFPYPSGLASNKAIEIRMETTANVNGTTVTATTGWVRVNSELAPALSISYPPPGWKVNTTGVVWSSVSFDAKVANANPTLRLVLLRATTPSHPPVEIRNESLAPVKTVGTVSFFNYTLGTNASLLTDGEYLVRFYAFDGTSLKAVGERTFAVSRTRPTLSFGVQPEDSDSRRRMSGSTPLDIFDVRHVFNLTFTVDHGLLNLTDKRNFTFDLMRSTPRDGFGNPVTNGSASGFTALVRSTTPLDDPARNKTSVTVTVTLPTSARDGDTFSLRVNATGDQWMPGDPADETLYKATGTVTLKLDNQPPSVGVFRAETNGTGDTNELAIRGFADDVGSGVEEIQVRIVDLTNNRTILWADPSNVFFAPGIVDEEIAWATSRLVANASQGSPGRAFVQNVVPVATSGNRIEWRLPQWNRPVLDENGTHVLLNGVPQYFRPLSELDNSSVYQVDVRARDLLGQATQVPVETEVRFDTRAPTIQGIPGGHGIGLSGAKANREVSWHGQPDDAWFFVNATDNKCLKRVSIRGVAPDGSQIEPVNLTPMDPALASCDTFVRNTPMTWYTTLRMSPGLTHQIGTYRYYVEAEDASGRVTTAPSTVGTTLDVKVLDTQIPVIRYVNLGPALIGEGTSSLIQAEVFENEAIGRVHVAVYRLVGGSLSFLANDTMRPQDVAANGTGLYVADTFSDLRLNLTRGDYVVQVSANDTAQTCKTCPITSAILRVSDEAPPTVTEDGGPRSFVNATPVLTFRAQHRDLVESGVQVMAGNSTENLTVVQPRLVPLPGAEGTRGFTVVYEPTGLASGEKLTVRIRATTNITGTGTFNYTVDAEAPELNHTMSALRTIGARQWATSASRLTLSAQDAGAGVASVTYTVGGRTSTYASPLSPPGNDSGTWTVEYQATDRVGNVGRGSVSVPFDTKRPTVTVSLHGDAPVVVVTDDGAGVDEGNVTVHYAYNGSQSFVVQKMQRRAGTANSFTATLPGDHATQGLEYWFQAVDLAGNTGMFASPASPWELEKNDTSSTNQPPTVRISAPEQGASVRGSVELRWTSFDAEGDAIKVTIGIIEPSNPAGRFLVIDAADTQSYTLNVSGFPAGSYTLTLQATDAQGAASLVERRSFVVEAGRTVTTITPPPATVDPGTEASFAVSIQPVGKTLKRATFVVTRDGAAYRSGELTVSQGYHVGAVTPTEPGDYRVSVVVEYEDGSQDAAVQVAAFQVPAPLATPGTPVSFIALLAVAVLTIALAAYGAFGRWK